MKPIYHFRVRLGLFDSDGENCLLWIGGRLIPDKKDPRTVWLTTPDGKKVFQALRSSVEPLSIQEAEETIVNEAMLKQAHRKSPQN